MHYTSFMETIDLSTHFSIRAEKLYKAWLDPVHHPAMSFGTEAEFDPQVGGAHRAGDGYIWGVFEELVPGKKIVMTWRTTDFGEDQPDSHVELTFTDAKEFYKVMYQALVGKDQGPRLASFLKIIGRAKLQEVLVNYR